MSNETQLETSGRSKHSEQARHIRPKDRLLFTLENDLQVAIQEDHFAPVVAIQIWVKAGSADETPDVAGAAHVHEHMLFKGTTRRPVGAIAAEIESSGGNINAFTTKLDRLVKDIDDKMKEEHCTA